MILERWRPQRFADALRSGEPVELRTTACGDWRASEVAPLCHILCHNLCHSVGIAIAQEWARWSAPAARPVGRAAPRVTVVIPANRGAPIGIRSLTAQDEPVVIRVLWNGSGAMPSIPEAQVSRVVWAGHGRTRQDSIAKIDTEYVLFTVDDALPLGAGFVRTMVEHLERSGADAVWARQVAWPDASRRTRDRLRVWCPESGDVPDTRLDHVCALHRTASLRADPLDAAPTAEDWLWGLRHRTALVVDAPVLHSHSPSFIASFTRTEQIHRVMLGAGASTAATPAAMNGAASLLRALPGALFNRDALGELLGQYAARDALGVASRPARP